MMTPFTKEKYDPIKMDKLKLLLESYAQRGKARYFEIYVDNLKAVDKNNDPASFDDYLMFLTEDTKMVVFVLYTASELSPRNDKFYYTLTNAEEEQRKAENETKALSGVEVQNQITVAIEAERTKNKTEQLADQLEETQEKLEEAEEYIQNLEDELATERNKKHSWKELNLGSVASLAFEEVIKRNPSWMSKVPLLGALSGLTSKDEPKAALTDTNTEGTASFKRKVVTEDTNDTAFSVVFFKQMESALDKEQMEKVYQINNVFIKHADVIDNIFEVLFTNPKKD